MMLRAHEPVHGGGTGPHGAAVASGPRRQSHRMTVREISAVGLASRVTPVQTARRNCTGDEGRSFEVGNQALISRHRTLPSLMRWPIACAMQHGVPLRVIFD